MEKIIYTLILSILIIEIGYRLLKKLRGRTIIDKVILDQTSLNLYECGFSSYYPTTQKDPSGNSQIIRYYIIIILLIIFDIEIAILLPLYILWNIKQLIIFIILILIIFSWYYELFIGIFPN